MASAGKSSTVSIVKTAPSPDQEAVNAAVRKAIDLVGGLGNIVKAGDRVLIKPNLAAPPPIVHYGAVNEPPVCRAIADMVKELGAHPVIGESSGVGIDTEEAIVGAGFAQLRDEGYEVIDLKKFPGVRVDCPEGKVVKDLLIYEPAAKADVIICVPKLKTHDNAEVTCSIKNMKGILHDTYKKRLHHEGLFGGCVDLISKFPARLVVVDAIVGMEGMGPVFGEAVEMNLILAGRDMVAVDAVGGKIIGFDPAEVLTTMYAAERGLGEADLNKIEVVGESIASVARRFKRVNESEALNIEGFNLIHWEGTCTGCRNAVMSSIFDLRGAQEIDFIKYRTIFTGDIDVPRTDPNNLFAVGICVPQEKRGKNYVPGCPPNNATIRAALKGEEEKALLMALDEKEKEEKKSLP